MKRAIVVALEWVCGAIDGLPRWTWRIPGLHRLGCPSGLGLLSARLDEKWSIGHWTATPE